MKISLALAGVHRVGLDTAPLIYFVEQQSTYVERVRAIFQHISTENIPIFTSTITLTEVLSKPLKTGDLTLVQSYRAFLLQTALMNLVSVDLDVAEKAAELRALYNLKTPDALQTATAISQKCDVFLTNDRGLQRVTELQVLLLDDLEVDAV